MAFGSPDLLLAALLALLLLAHPTASAGCIVLVGLDTFAARPCQERGKGRKSATERQRHTEAGRGKARGRE